MSSIRTLKVPISIGNICEKLYQYGILNESEEVTNGHEMVMVEVKIYKRGGIELIKNGAQL
jgi:hypothetical protein